MLLIMNDIHRLLPSCMVPPEPASRRGSIRRKLKGMGAVHLRNGDCLLSKTDDHVRRPEMLENDVAKAEGESVILETVGLDAMQAEKVVARFRADRDAAREAFVDNCDDFEREVAKEIAASHCTYAALAENDVDLKKLQGWRAMICKLDFHGDTRAAEAEARLKACEAVLDDGARRVFDAHEENG